MHSIGAQARPQTPTPKICQKCLAFDVAGLGHIPGLGYRDDGIVSLF